MHGNIVLMIATFNYLLYHTIDLLEAYRPFVV